MERAKDDRGCRTDQVRAVVQDEALLLVFIGQSHRVKEHGPARLEPASEPRRA